MNRRLLMLRLMLMPGGYRKAEYLRKIHYFHKQGKHCCFIPFNYGTEPHLLSFGDNVCVASGVHFINHDISAQLFQYMDPQNTYVSRVGPITVGSNVFIGTGSTILYDVTIGDNVIIAAGSVVTKDVPSGTVYGGVPAKKICDYEDIVRKNALYSQKVTWTDQDPPEIRRKKQIAFCYPDEETGA